jgi:hypothetical protein
MEGGGPSGRALVRERAAALRAAPRARLFGLLRDLFGPPFVCGPAALGADVVLLRAAQDVLDHLEEGVHAAPSQERRLAAKSPALAEMSACGPNT